MQAKLFYSISTGVVCPSMPQRASVGEKFFDSMSYAPMLKKMKKRLNETVDFHLKIQTESRTDPRTSGASDGVTPGTSDATGTGGMNISV
jgi:hypothetical protein